MSDIPNSKSLSRLDLLVRSLCEKKEVFWHGTSTARYQSIKSKGLNPDMKDHQKQYGKFSGSIESFRGTYFAQDVLTVISNAGNMGRRDKAYPLVIEAILEVRTTLYDEDVVLDMNIALPRSYYMYTGQGSYRFVHATAQGLMYDSENKESKEKVLHDAVEYWLDHFVYDKKMQSERKKSLRPLIREWAELVLKHAADNPDYFYSSISPESSAERKIRDEVYHKLRGLPNYLVPDLPRKVRTTETVGFSGANKIIAMYAIDEKYGLTKDPGSDIYLIYGKEVNQSFLYHFQDRIGDYTVKKSTIEEAIESMNLLREKYK